MTIMPDDLTKVAVPMDEWRRELLLAAERIQIRGFAKHMLCDLDGANCLIGALFDYRPGIGGVKIYAPGSVANSEAFEKLSDALGRHNIVHWNNQPERTKEEVINKLIEVALAP